VYHRRFGPVLAEDPKTAERVLIDVDDGSGVAPLDGSIAFEDAVAAGAGDANLPEPSPDDLYMLCTGGTTGTPKGVLWRQADIYVAAMGGSDGASPELITSIAEIGMGVLFPAPPLMHGAAQWTAFSGFHNGGSVVFHDDSTPFDAKAILGLCERERVTVMSIVGEAFARPILDELRAGTYDLSALGILGTGGAATSAATKHALLELLPHLTIMDGYGASETGAAGYAASTKDNESREFAPAAGSAVVSEDLTRFLAVGDEEVGWAARIGRIPLGYLNDPDKTERTFPVVDGTRASVPGDRAHYDDQGRIVMLGRDSLVINTGGEKVFVEEVEDALRLHPGIDDALVVGRPNDRFGQEVVALVQLHPGAELTAARSARSPPSRSPGSRRLVPCASATASAGCPPASPTTRGPRRPPSTPRTPRAGS
jgi:fatty-acyl-CoA synthase